MNTMACRRSQFVIVILAFIALSSGLIAAQSDIEKTSHPTEKKITSGNKRVHKETSDFHARNSRDAQPEAACHDQVLRSIISDFS